MKSKRFKLNQIAAHEMIAGYQAKVIHSDTMTFVYWNIAQGAPLPEHSHPHEQVAHILEGSFEITINGQTTILEEGDVATIPSNAIHSGKAITECRIMDAFSPIREDYRKFA